MKHTAETLQAAFRYFFPDEIPALKKLARMLPDNPVVINIGAGAGTSGLAFMESRDDLFLYTIDITLKSSPYGSLESEESVLKEAGLWNPPQSNWQICDDSKYTGKNWGSDFTIFGDINIYPEHNKVDLVFIDGNHSYEGCRDDILAWLPNIKSGGIIAVHDYGKAELFEHERDFQDDKPHPKPWPGVDKAVDEFLVDKYEQILRVDSLIAFRV